jgi:hypothetical protein
MINSDSYAPCSQIAAVIKLPYKQMALFDSLVHEHIGDYRKAVVVREGPLNDATIYYMMLCLI